MPPGSELSDPAHQHVAQDPPPVRAMHGVCDMNIGYREMACQHVHHASHLHRLDGSAGCASRARGRWSIIGRLHGLTSQAQQTSGYSER
jgi:hypothetical protein